jgi:ribosomal protein L29
MKKDILQQLKTKDVEQLEVSVAQAKEKLSQLLFALRSGKTASVKEIREKKKEIAVLSTLINEKRN